ncbi:MAG: sugar ABC transporter permease [Treponemataceae bacterium]|nr:sugar ABC transporter permease [Treponemataceae bacterium]
MALAEIENEFDANYDGCSLCARASSHGKRATVHRAWFRGPLVTSLIGLATLGSKQPTTVTKYMDHSIFMMINGIFALIVIAFFVLLYIINIRGAKAAVEKIIKNGKFPTMKEAKNDMSQNSFATIGIAPSIIMIAIFSLIPLLFSALVAFTNYSSPDHIPPNNLVDWVGLDNFVQMFSTKVGGGEWARTFASTAVWTIVWAIFATFTCFFVGFFYAFVLQDKRIIIPRFFRTVYIFPYAIPTMLSLFVWANLLNGTIGPINRTLQLIGLIDQPIPWLSHPNVAKFSLIFVNIWIGFPYSMILTTSSMTAISNSLYEAAVIDGATKWQQFRSITYPLVMFQLKPTLIMQFAGNINNFGAVFFLTGGGPNLPQAGLTTVTNCGATDLLISWIYKLTMNTPSRYNLASVLSLLVFVVLVPFALYNFTRTKSFKEGEI